MAHRSRPKSTFLGVHTYAQWEGKTIDEAIPYTIDNIVAVCEAFPDKPIAILEAGWATVATEFGDRASEEFQARYYAELDEWAQGNKHDRLLLRGIRRTVEGQPR